MYTVWADLLYQRMSLLETILTSSASMRSIQNAQHRGTGLNNQQRNENRLVNYVKLVTLVLHLLDPRRFLCPI